MVAKLVRTQPELLTVALGEWYQFLTGYGLTDEGVWKVLRHCPRLLLGPEGGTANTPYNAGAAIVFLKSYGWTDEAVLERVLPCYPEVLAARPEQLQAAVDFLRSRKFGDEAIRRMVLTFPPLLTGPYNDSLFALIDRIRASAHNKYVVSGSYHV
ncbi:hypothetical protein GPECTOR_2g1039 [Gonium pectorale]|uniref:Uncharacterized protein n=1 Tax=Gonium pectorale TaxID=33097 RepID=A0A150H1N8_GONPE|nr:hypothetical protein GPECTOR_2g1039 [Gonium pectorale]|eukprot:KXZ55490.1 hypothetical protein GPECTOR_2g1039 [Gonium pectorale]